MTLMGTNTTKPYKIQEVGGIGRIGITATNLQDLKNQALKLLNIPEDFEPHLDDGTAVLTEEYFRCLPQQTCFTFFAPNYGNSKTDLIQLEKLTLKLSKSLAEQNTKCLDEVKQFLCGENSEVINRALLDYVSTLQSNIASETREEDGEWFEGLPDRYQTKEAVMEDGAKTRIKNYYQKTREYLLQEQNPSQQGMELLDDLRQELHFNKYNGNYFCRSAWKNVRICDDLGWFKCEGKFNEKNCAKSHSINPYGSKETRIIFSTWNLDHVVEKSREILPTLAEVIKQAKGRDINWQYFYDLLFTKKNLKLVHVACHIKGVHSGKKCDKKQFYKAKTISRKPAKNSSQCRKWVLRSRR
ncbi:DNA fragmentation factor subunit beta-like [Dendronephthya gigantea]|uniref:DNA fragmentation factor subunit beta-like n=1 Tax=Dendronephthya gigantea TaxID=151771 RepID=UPI0010690F1B|nr:DNA fragmentation factor subunit beta-like [Dendronephthya gigantea]XP_028393546.1 DNA fragmentation factor subunit beta-like [Dendronephthya gigantea]